MSVKPKKSCCQDRPRCKRCPIRLLADGKLDPETARALFAKDRNKKALRKAVKKGDVKKGDVKKSDVRATDIKAEAEKAHLPIAA